MKIPLFQVDAFTTKVFAGNPAAICPLDAWLEPARMQEIAAENNLSETAFLVPNEDGYDLRWFTPVTEADLCGHATLASAYVLWNHLGDQSETLRFNTRSGLLTVKKQGELLVMNFPRLAAAPCSNAPAELVDGLGALPDLVLSYMETEGSGNFLAVFTSETHVREMTPDFHILGRLEGMGVIVTAPGESADFASRYFAPGYGIDEDPVTGSIHCTLVPYWSERLGKQKLHAHQVSRRGGELFCELKGDRVSIAGHAVCFMTGTIEV